MCCAGCQAVARTIVAAGFERYYETRSEAGPQPQDLPPLEAYDDPLAQKEFVAASGENLREAALILDRIRCAACLWLSEQWLRQVPGVQRVEINEAFAAIALACLRELGLAEDVVNVEGGAIAHGHPIGATGAVLATRMMLSMKRDGLKHGIATLCFGGGQCIALALEALGRLGGHDQAIHPGRG